MIKRVTNKAKSQICLGLALLLIVLNCISSFILIAPYEAIKDNTLPFIGAFLGSYVHYRKKEKNNDFPTKKDKIFLPTTFFILALIFSWWDKKRKEMRSSTKILSHPI